MNGLASSCSRRAFLGVVGGGTALVALAGCRADDVSEGARGETRRVDGALGAIDVPVSPQRVASVGQYRDTDAAVALGVVPLLSPNLSTFIAGGVTPWVKEALGRQRLNIVDVSAMPFESIAALKPDLILATDRQKLAEEYEQLSLIAPTLSWDHGYNKDDWRTTTTRIGEALGRSAEAAEQVELTEKAIAAARAENPDFEGRTFTLGPVTADGTVNTINSTSDASAEFMSQLGLTLAPAVTQLPMTHIPGRAVISTERLSLLEADVVMLTYNTPRARSMLESDSLFKAIPAVRRGSYAELELPLALAIGFPSALSADRIAVAAQEHTGRSVLGLRDVQFRRWVTAPTTTRLRTEVSGPTDEPTVTLSAWHEANTQALSRFVVAATGRVVLRDRPPPAPARFDPLPDARPEPLVYETGNMFHGPSMQYQKSLHLGSTGSTAVVTCDRDPVEHGILHPGVLDGCLHGIPCWSLHQWSPSLDPDMFGLPLRFPWIDLHQRIPASGTLEAEARFVGSEDDDRLRPMVDFQLCDTTNVLMSVRLVLGIIPHPRIWNTPLHRSRAFARNREYVPEMLMSEEDGEVSILRRTAVENADYIPGSIARMHELPDGVRAIDRMGSLVAREHLARLEQVHPGAIALSHDLRTARCGDREYRLVVTETDESATARLERTA